MKCNHYFGYLVSSLFILAIICNPGVLSSHCPRYFLLNASWSERRHLSFFAPCKALPFFKGLYNDWRSDYVREIKNNFFLICCRNNKKWIFTFIDIYIHKTSIINNKLCTWKFCWEFYKINRNFRYLILIIEIRILHQGHIDRIPFPAY